MNEMQCECLDKIRQEVKKDYEANGEPASYVLFDMANISELGAGKGFKTGQRVEIQYKKKLRNDTLKDATLKTHIGHDYCPFCGMKYI